MQQGHCVRLLRIWAGKLKGKGTDHLQRDESELHSLGELVRTHLVLRAGPTAAGFQRLGQAFLLTNEAVATRGHNRARFFVSCSNMMHPTKDVRELLASKDKVKVHVDATDHFLERE